MKKKLQQIMSKLKEHKKPLIIGLICLIVIGAGALIINFNSSESLDNSSLLSNQTVDNLEFLNATLENNKLTVVVHNTLDNNYNLKTIDVTYLDGEGNVITTVNGYIGDKIEKDDMKQLVVNTDVDISQAEQIKYVINK